MMNESSSLQITREFLNNRSQIPPTELAKHAGKYVAWSPDGRRIVASASDEGTLEESLRRSGVDPAQTPIGWIPDKGEAALGGLQSV